MPPASGTLTIKGGSAGTGVLNVKGGYGSACIGTGKVTDDESTMYTVGNSCGDILISGGDINASSENGTGIGCGNNSRFGNITVANTVTKIVISGQGIGKLDELSGESGTVTLPTTPEYQSYYEYPAP